MTEKQEKILQTALRLFAKEGYTSTSTSKVAKEAGVSEGLIFRHFKNKEGLLQAIMEQANEKAQVIFAPILLTTDSKDVIRRTLELPFHLSDDEYEVWRLMYAIKWQTNIYDKNAANSLKGALEKAFLSLNYSDPLAETELILMLLDGAATSILLHEPENKTDILDVLKQKYSL